MKKALITFAAALGLASLSQAALIVPISSSHTGTISGGSDANVIDGSIPAESTGWSTASANLYWMNLDTFVTVDLGALYTIQDILVSVDNNDNYQISYSTNGSVWSSLATILYTYGEIYSGMDTMSSDSTHAEYVSGIDFATPVDARFLKLQAIAGGRDSLSSVGEIQAFGTKVTNSVPDTGSTALLTLLGLSSLVALRKRFNK